MHAYITQAAFSVVGFEYFLKYVIEYCVPGKMTELTMSSACGERAQKTIDDELLIQIQPFICNLAKLTIVGLYNDFDKEECFDTERAFKRFFEHSRSRLVFLKSLKLEMTRNINDYPEFLPTDPSNITEIYLSNVWDFKNLNEFQLILNRLENLQVFVYTHDNCNAGNIEAMGNCLHQRFPKLRGFGFCVGKIRAQHRFEFLEKFKDLTELHLELRGCSVFAANMQCLTNIIKYVPNIKTLSIYQIMSTNQLPAVVRRISQLIKKLIDNRCNRCPANDRVHINVNHRQYREFRAMKSVDSFISLEIRSSNITQTSTKNY